jgi:hypothetical protein
MGYNRSGNRRSARLRRHRKEERRLAAKAAQGTPAAADQKTPAPGK